MIFDEMGIVLIHTFELIRGKARDQEIRNSIEKLSILFSCIVPAYKGRDISMLEYILKPGLKF